MSIPLFPTDLLSTFDSPPPFRNVLGPDIPRASLTKIAFTYYRLLTSYNNRKEDLCTICQETETTTNFCSQHTFHLPCLVNTVYGCSRNLIEKLKIVRTNYTLQASFSSTYSHSTYTLTILKENLPKCPNCRETEGMFLLEAKVVDRYQGVLKTEIEIEKSPASFPLRFATLKIFDNVTTILTVFEAFLSYVQNATPALAGRIFAVQKLLLFADIVIVARNCLLLYPLIKQRLETIDRDRWKKKLFNKYTLAGIAVLTLATTAAICSIGRIKPHLFSFNCYFKPDINPKEFLKSIPIADLCSVSCKWVAAPMMQQILQITTIGRIASEFALAYFSKKRFRHLGHSILQIFTLCNISQLQWLDFERTISNPLRTVPFTFQNNSSQEDHEFYSEIVKQIRMNFTVLIPKNSSLSTDVPTMINSVYEYSSNLFKNSMWKGHTISSSFAVSSIHYTIQLALPLLEFPYIHTKSVWITTRLNWDTFETIPYLIFPR